MLSQQGAYIRGLIMCAFFPGITRTCLVSYVQHWVESGRKKPHKDLCFEKNVWHTVVVVHSFSVIRFLKKPFLNLFFWPGQNCLPLFPFRRKLAHPFMAQYVYATFFHVKTDKDESINPFFIERGIKFVRLPSTCSNTVQ